MIFVTVGSDRYPFNRLVRAVDDTCIKRGLKEPVVFQYGSCTYLPKAGRAERFLPFREVRALIERAGIIITHGGVGSIGLSLSYGKKPIVFPRLASLHEAIDDHQSIYAERMENEGYIYYARSAEELESYLTRAAGGEIPLGADYNFEERKKLCAFLDRALAAAVG